MLAQKELSVTPEEYLFQERLAESKSEYVNGEIFAMAGASREHNLISSNVVIGLGAQLFDTSCSIYSSDMKVKIESAKKYTYPDVLVTCDKERFEDDKKDVLLNPIVIIEVLSDSTEAYDRGLKFFHYQSLRSFVEYYLISQKFCHVEKFERQNNNLWIYSEYHDMNDQVEIKAINSKVFLKDIYRKVDFVEKIV